MPSASWKMIDDINSIIDNPSQQAGLFGKALERKVPDPKTGEMKIINPFDIYGLGQRSPHRRTNHDPLSASVMGFKAHGLKGSILSNLHTMMDVVSDKMKDRTGVVGRDLWEANVNYMLEKHIIPQVVAHQKMMAHMTNSNLKSLHKQGNRSTGRYMKSRMNMHKSFIPSGRMIW
jgi:hypothetical protein